MIRGLALALALAGCAPSLVWSGWSPDHAVRAVLVEEGGAQRLTVGEATRRYDALAVERLGWSDRGLAAPGRRGGAWWVVDADREHGPYAEVGPLVIAGAHLAFAARRDDGWRVVVDGREGEPFDAIDERILLDAESGAVAYVARRRGAEHAVWGDRIGPPCGTVALLTLGAKGASVAYVDRGARDRLFVDHQEIGGWDEVLELAIGADEPGWAAIVAEGDASVLIRGGGALGRAPLLTHLRVSDDGAHAACLAPAADGASIAVIVDGETLATHRRVEGAALAFVPGTATLVYLAEESQGIQVIAGGVVSARYEEVEGPVYAPGRVGWIGRRGDRSEIAIDGAVVATEPWAGTLRLAREGGGYAYVARGEDGARFVITRRGRWPVPQLFVDTLEVDATAHHWAALVPDASARRLDVWVDGAPRAVIADDELGSAVIAGDRAPLDAVRALVAGELRRALRAAGE